VPAPGEEAADSGTRVLGTDPETGLEVTVRSGRFGPYVQLGDAVDGEKPKRTALPKGMDPASVDLETALKLLALPREVGRHPESGEPIIAGLGRYGPYIQHGKTYANLEAGDDVLNIGLNRAVTLIAEKAAKGGRGRRAPAPGRVLGEHPEKGGEIVVRAGRYGPYASHNGVNATLPADKSPDTITLEEAVPLIDARASRLGDQPAKRRAPRKTAAKKAKPPAAAAEAEAKPKRRAAKAP
jgi:DNA topoisomerase I